MLTVFFQYLFENTKHLVIIFFMVAPCNLIYVEFTHKQMHFLLKKNIKIYIEIHMNIVATCFGLRLSSGSLH